ncbi:DUF3304 domain-containing protein [Pseudomonas sp. GW456-L14]|uniref:DUF3304 domain-containing protein n=1 Tax=unclassified Pseudomonas TaxID=196821 RepID=UPI0009D9B10F|nr:MULTISPECIES: DUF3304 domain-containing protein [unclassified Pseudomonas]PMY31993.1 DUF3304 domain-containing protein [Pseudomonas sp. GW456-L14]PMY53306.1 DUF3304 domain-containing protein [Pseudomonas sp. GW456-L12]WIE47258.1 DUF3304 domain-containing protein [Pseudomonas sp. GM17]
MTSIQSLRNRWKSLSGLQKTLINLLVWGGLIAAYFIWQYSQMPGAMLYVHNQTDRPIFSYFVNDNWGGNATANGGGGATCCWRIEGKTLKVDWIKGRTGEQVRQGVQKETLSVEIANPPRQRTDRYLHVHFFPGDQVRLAWSANLDTPYENLKEAPPVSNSKDQETKSQ